MHRTPDGGVEITAEGGGMPLVQPDQGGKVALVSVRARNLDCRLDLTASFRDECDGTVVALEKRPIELELQADGWAEPKQPVELGNYSNLPACPRSGAKRNIQGEPYLLRIQVVDRDQRTAEALARVVPYCAEPSRLSLCLCECDQRYSLGEPCTGDPTDSGLPQGACPSGDR